MEERIETGTPILSVSEDGNGYCVSIGEGTSVPEVVFCLAVVGRCLVRDGYYDNPIEVEALFHRYLTGDEFKEVDYIEQVDNGVPDEE